MGVWLLQRRRNCVSSFWVCFFWVVVAVKGCWTTRGLEVGNKK